MLLWAVQQVAGILLLEHRGDGLRRGLFRDWDGAVVESGLKVVEHFANVRVTRAVFDDAHAGVVAAPFDDFDVHVANAPIVHG